MRSVPGLHIPSIHTLVPLPFLEVTDAAKHLARLSEEMLPSGAEIFPVHGDGLQVIFYDIGEGPEGYAELLVGWYREEGTEEYRLIAVDRRPDRNDEFRIELERAAQVSFPTMLGVARRDYDGSAAGEWYIIPTEELEANNIRLSPRARSIHWLLHQRWKFDRIVAAQRKK